MSDTQTYGAQMAPARRAQRSEQEKVEMCRAYLVNRGWFVFQKMLTTKMVAELMNVSQPHITNLMEKDETFPKPYNLVGSGSLSDRFGGRKRPTMRWSAAEIQAWLEKRRVT